MPEKEPDGKWLPSGGYVQAQAARQQQAPIQGPIQAAVQAPAPVAPVQPAPVPQQQQEDDLLTNDGEDEPQRGDNAGGQQNADADLDALQQRVEANLDAVLGDAEENNQQQAEGNGQQGGDIPPESLMTA